MEKKNVILLTVIAVATLLITVVGATFAYFAADITNGDKIDTTTIKAAEGLTITFNNGEKITGNNILPGWGETYASGTKNEITVSNDTQYDVEFKMKWASVTNSFAEADQKNLKYSAVTTLGWTDNLEHEEKQHSEKNDVEEAQFPATDSTPEFVTQSLKPGEKVTYAVHVSYHYDESNPQDSKGKGFNASLKIDNGDIKVSQAAAE